MILISFEGNPPCILAAQGHGFSPLLQLPQYFGAFFSILLKNAELLEVQQNHAGPNLLDLQGQCKS